MATDAGGLMPTIDAIFAQMTLTYGQRRLEAFYMGQEIEVVKRFWCHTLRGMSPVDLLYALDHMPADNVPNVLQFKALAQKTPMPHYPMLPNRREKYVPDMEAIARVRAAIEPLRLKLAGQHPRAWIERLELRQRELAIEGRKLTAFQQQCLDEARGRSKDGDA
jgi:hypothetical protein